MMMHLLLRADSFLSLFGIPMEQAVADRFNAINAAWLGVVFDNGCLVNAVWDRSKNSGSAWEYLFGASRLALPREPSGPCGNTGGTRKNGVPCRKMPRKGGIGRCPSHPYQTVSITFKGKPDGDRRPFPLRNLLAGDLNIVADGADYPVADPDQQLPPFLSASHVERCRARHKCDLKLPLESTLLLPSGDHMAVDPLWLTTTVLAQFGETAAVLIDGRKVERGHTLEDYGVNAGVNVRLPTRKNDCLPRF